MIQQLLLLEKDNVVDEDILVSSKRFTLFPIMHQDIYDEYKKAEASLWTANEIDFGADKNDWESMTEDEKYFIEHILAFFAGSDGIVLENLMSTFASEVQWIEARMFYGLQAYVESIHEETYSLMIDTLVTDRVRKHELFNAIEKIPCIALKAEWSMKWMDPNTIPFHIRILGFIIVEGIFFSGSFCSIFWLKNRGKMCKALAKSNELIARDEGLHTEFGIMLYHKLNNKAPEELVHAIFKEAVDIETTFICESLPCKLIGMNSDLMTQYIKYVSDMLITKLGYEPIYESENPFTFMESSDYHGKTNFFEERVTEYRRSYSVSTSSERNISGPLGDNEDF